MKFKNKIVVEDEKFSNSNELYDRLADILITACRYDIDKHDTIATVQEVEKYLNAIKKGLIKEEEE